MRETVTEPVIEPEGPFCHYRARQHQGLLSDATLAIISAETVRSIVAVVSNFDPVCNREILLYALILWTRLHWRLASNQLALRGFNDV